MNKGGKITIYQISLHCYTFTSHFTIWLGQPIIQDLISKKKIIQDFCRQHLTSTCGWGKTERARWWTTLRVLKEPNPPHPFLKTQTGRLSRRPYHSWRSPIGWLATGASGGACDYSRALRRLQMLFSLQLWCLWSIILVLIELLNVVVSSLTCSFFLVTNLFQLCLVW